MPTIPELTALFGLIALAISMIILNKRYDVKHNEIDPVIKRKHK